MYDPNNPFNYNQAFANLANEDAANALSQLSGRSRAKDALALNSPYNPPLMDVAQSQLGLNAWAQSPNNPSNITREIVPYNRGSIEAAYRGGAPATNPAVDRVLAQQVSSLGGQRALPMGAARAYTGPGAGGGLPPYGGGTPYRMPPTAPRALGPGRLPTSLGGVPGIPPQVSQMMGFGTGPAKATGLLGRFPNSPILQWLNKAGGGKGALGKILPGAVNPATGKLGLMAAGRSMVPWALAGEGVNMLTGFLPGESEAEDVLGNTARYAGIGAGIGSLFPGAGTLIGGLGGGLYGAITGGFNAGKEKKDPVNQTKLAFFDALKTSDLSDEAKSQIVDQYKIMASLAKTDEEKLAALQQAGTMVMEQSALGQQSQMDTEAMLASQAMLQKFLQPQMNNIRNSSRNQAEFMRGIIPNLPKEFQQGARITSNQRLGDADRIAAAYGMESMLQPQMAAMEARNAQLAQLQQADWQEAMDLQRSGGAGNTLENLLGTGG